MNIVAFIPARGNSKSIQRDNYVGQFSLVAKKGKKYYPIMPIPPCYKPEELKVARENFRRHHSYFCLCYECAIKGIELEERM